MIKRIYLIKYESNLEHVVVEKFKGSIMRSLALSMIQNYRDQDNSDQDSNIGNRNDDSTTVDMKLVSEDSDRLYQAGEAQRGTDEKPFIEIFTKRSFAHLSKLDSFYQNANPKGHSLVRAVELEFIGNVGSALLDILLYAKEPYRYWAECFNRALSHWGSKENDLTRLSITQHYQAANIKQAFLSCYNQSLVLKISKKTSGKYKKLILLLINV
ncbi:hypothetical protein DICPUDRAFT_83254 [Dictyostelium purpureum]|uniref:Uncharacterized protein n=1 Tax=Dictyostelium purpureum TaxID=5786 RepID=F0ZZ05_DICPU|nr:uncharacterized protein DICPUDRAFT_83254 [Dictyostelium purpureum]EGC30827.1 hypothetical protein DICPUDRAFT_83254 [Dictyostelium purpureum]|eukprot:XP_003292641.1 hypothetical protein DICPUDRAFT_83254 [Dictyostelium purpureum]